MDWPQLEPFRPKCLQGMNLLFATQSDSLPMFVALAEALAKRLGNGRCAFTLADSWSYADWLRRNPSFETQGHYLLKEWHLTGVRDNDPDYALLERYERELGGPGLFGAIVADRRLIMGADCTYTQDYRRRFSDRELLSILQTATVAVDRMFEAIQPDAVVTFICVTILDYLVYLFARARGVRVLNLRTTRIGNHVHFSSTLNDPSPELLMSMAQVGREDPAILEGARAHINLVRTTHGRYEGVVKASAKPAQKIKLSGSVLISSWRLSQTWWRYRCSESFRDNHCPGPLRPIVFKGLINPWRARRADKLLRASYSLSQGLAGRRFAFYPMHTEPEVSLLVYGRPLLNQIEVIRAIALSLPAGMALVVKEHPWMVGKRSIGSYRKLLNIPNVLLAPPESEARYWVKAAAVTVVLTSSVGLEAAILGRPVVTLGHCPFNALPDLMVRRCADLMRLPQTLREMLESHSHDEGALEQYVAAVMQFSVKVNLYSTLLGRSSTFSSEGSHFTDDIKRLANYAAVCLKRPVVKVTEAAEW